MESMISLAVLLCLCASVYAQNACDVEGVSSTADIRLSGDSDVLHEVPARVGNPLFLTCVVTLDGGSLFDTPPLIDSYQWFRNGAVLSQFTTANLQIASATSEDGGEYSCRAVTSVPCFSVESDITTVTTVPSVILNPPNDFTVNEGERVQISCSVAGWPVPTIEWTRSTSENTVVSISTNPTVVIDSASVEDSGDYTCIATNNRGNNRDTITVTVNEVTEPPTEPSTATPQPTTVTSGEGDDASQMGVPRPEPEEGFYIAIAVVAFVCLILTILMIVSIIIWVVRKQCGAAEGPPVEEEML